MSLNSRIAAVFDEMATIMELLGEDRFRVGAYQRAARSIEGLSVDLAALAADKKALTDLEGIGSSTADKIIEFVKTGKVKDHEALVRRVPAGLLEVLQVPGLGPKTVALLWKEKGVESIADLKRIIEDGSILDLPRMGEKTVANIKAALAFAESSGERMHLGRALPIAEALVERLRALKTVREVSYAGSLRRGKETIGDVDILVATDKPGVVHKAFVETPGVEQVLASGESKSSVRVRAGLEDGKWAPEAKGAPLVQVDLRTLPPESWGAGLMYFTGSKELNVRLRERALKQGLTLNEYGLYPEDDDKTPPQHRGVKPKASKTEEAIYEALGLPWIPPEIREDRGELLLEETPRLIEVSDIRAELHAHTTESDGAMTLPELVRQAKARGFHTIGVTDHSKSSVQANGLSVERLRQQREQIAQLAEQTKGIRVLCGSEVDILLDGRLDYEDEVLAELDLVIASPHAALTQDAKKATKRLVKAIEHPLVHVLGHPTGRLINRRKGLEPDMSEIVAAAKANHVALEINAHWLRLDLRDAHVRTAVEAGCAIAINCDVHVPGDFDHLRYGVLTGRRGWLTPDLCVNAWTEAKLRKWLSSKR